MSHQGKKIFVFLATGDQGTSVVRHLIKDGFEVYGMTRNPNSDKAKAIEKMGAHLVKGDMGDVNSYAHALEGMDGVFINADYFSVYFSNGLDADAAGKTEEEQSRAAADAAIKAKVPHIVYSTLGDITPDGSEHKGHKYPHHDSKARVSKYLMSIGAPVTHLFTSSYISEFIKFDLLKKQDDGSWLLAYPCTDDCPLPAYAVEQAGLWVSAVFKDPATWIGKRLDIIADESTLAEVAEKLAEVTGQTITTQHMTKEYFFSEELGHKISPELQLQWLQFYNRHMIRDMQQSKSVVPEQWDVTAWAEQSPELEALMHWRK